MTLEDLESDDLENYDLGNDNLESDDLLIFAYFQPLNSKRPYSSFQGVNGKIYMITSILSCGYRCESRNS